MVFRIFLSSILMSFAVCGLAAADDAATSFGKSLARGGQTTAERDLSSRDPQAELGVSAEGAESGGGRRVDVNYSQVLKASLDCPVTVGEGGRRVGVQQFVAQCQTQSGSNRKIWVCAPSDVNDVTDTGCSNGTWHQVMTSPTAGWKSVFSGLQIRLSSCSNGECILELNKSEDFSGGESEAQAEGDNVRNSSSGVTGVIRDQGAALPDGTILSPGSNANSGQYVGELVAAGGIGACADDVKASIANGTPVFTCDGQTEVDTFTGGEASCRDVETCLNVDEEERLSAKTCQVSLTYSGAQCRSVTPKKMCTLSNIVERVSCITQKTAEFVAGEFVPSSFEVPYNQTVYKPSRFSNKLRLTFVSAKNNVDFPHGPGQNYTGRIKYSSGEGVLVTLYDGEPIRVGPAPVKSGVTCTPDNYSSCPRSSFGSARGTGAFINGVYSTYIGDNLSNDPHLILSDLNTPPVRAMTEAELQMYLPNAYAAIKRVSTVRMFDWSCPYPCIRFIEVPISMDEKLNTLFLRGIGMTAHGDITKYVTGSPGNYKIRESYYQQGYRLNEGEIIKLNDTEVCN